MFWEKYRIAALLQLFQYAVIQPRIMMVRTRQHHHADAILSLQHVKDGARALMDGVLIFVPCFKTFLNGPFIFFFGKAQQRLPALQHLLSEELAVGEVHQRVKIADVVLGEDIDLLGVGRLDCLRRHCNSGTGVAGASAYER